MATLPKAFLYLISCIALLQPMAWGQLGNVWHIPGNTENGIPATMRNPLYEAKNMDMVIYQGFWKNGGANGDQNGGSLKYRVVPRGGAAGDWQTVELEWHADVPENGNQYWKATLPSQGIAATDVIEYYVVVTFNASHNPTPVTTYIYGKDLGSSLTTADENVAQNAPFSIRNRPGWIFYSNNRIVSGNSLQVRVRTGYIGENNDPSTSWSTHGAIYFTTDGGVPSGSLGVPSGSTQSVALIADGTEFDNSGNGNAHLWQGTLADVLASMNFGDVLRYRIGLWHEDTEEEKFADHAAGPDNFIFEFQNGIIGNPYLVVNGINADYGVLNYYIDEVQDTVFPWLNITFYPGTAAGQVEVYTNLNNRNRAELDYNNDGTEDGISPPDGNSITVSDTGAYFQAYTMTQSDVGTYSLTLPVLKTGAYRLTARFRENEESPWTWVSSSGIRDLAVVVAPKQARDMVMYELHVTNANAVGPTFAQRGTFEDLHDPAARINLSWLRDMGVNWIWFQPFHPQGLDGKQIDPATGQEYDPGSPYSIRNFWEINPLYSREWDDDLPNAITHPENFAAAMRAFQDFAAVADERGVYLMLDFPFNHTAPDVVLAEKGIDLFAPESHDWQPGDLIRDRVPQFFSTNGGSGAAYSARAAGSWDIAVAPDRSDFGKWADVRDVFFGNYATLVIGNPDAGASRATVQNEQDWFDYNSLDENGGRVTLNVWRYFAAVLPYWLERSGHRGHNEYDPEWDLATRIAEDARGIDGLRKDFGQGLPPQAMEYIINVTHSRKWNFVFMSESLDGGAVTYRSSRHFAVLNENIVFPLQEATTTSGYRGVFNDRRNAYGLSLVLLNNTSHDEKPYEDPWQALIRYATVSTNDGSPMIMYGQEIGASTRVRDSLPQGSWDWYEMNFGKYIPNFKKWNSMQPQWNAWTGNSLGIKHLRPVYAAIGQARQFSPSLRSPNRWFLNRQANGNEPNEHIYSVAKYTEAFIPLAQQDVVFAFTNLNRYAAPSDTFQVPDALGELLGLSTQRTYNVKNIAAYLGPDNEYPGRRDLWLWGVEGRTGQNILDQGITVFLNAVPNVEEGWETAPYEAQFLKVYDVTPPPSVGAPATVNALGYSATGELVMTWDSSAFGPHDNVLENEVVVTDGESNVIFSGRLSGTNGFSWAIPEEHYGKTVTVQVRPVSIAGISASSASATSAPVILLDPDGDADDNGMSNFAEYIAGTDPFDASSVLRATNIAVTGASSSVTLDGVPGRRYRLMYSEDFFSGVAEPEWQAAGDWVAAMSNAPITLVDSEEDPPSRIYKILVEIDL